MLLMSPGIGDYSEIHFSRCAYLNHYKPLKPPKINHNLNSAGETVKVC